MVNGGGRGKEWGWEIGGDLGMYPISYKGMYPFPYKGIYPFPYKSMYPFPYKGMYPSPYKEWYPPHYRGWYPILNPSFFPLSFRGFYDCFFKSWLSFMAQKLGPHIVQYSPSVCLPSLKYSSARSGSRERWNWSRQRNS